MLNHSREIKAVTFDVGGTLIRPWPSVGEVYAAVARRHGWTIDPPALDQQFRHAWRGKGGFDYSRDAWARLVETAFAPFSPVPGSVPFFDELYDAFRDPAAWEVLPDVRLTLTQLREAGLRLGIISNWDERLRPLLAALNLHTHFDAVTVSHEVGRTKPAPEIFHHACRLLGLSPGEVLHVGDSENEDVAGALAAGMSARLVSQGALKALAGELCLHRR